MQCPGFANFKNLPLSESNAAADEGTAAGELLQAMLEQRTLKPTVPLTAKNKVNFDSDMYYYVTPIAESILKVANHVSCEERIDWDAHTELSIRGSYDICYFTKDTMHIEDLKYGFGIVEVFKNWQLIGYAIGKYYKLDVKSRPKFIEFKIHQPRPYHEDGTTRSWKITEDELLAFYSQILDQAKIITRGIGELKTGPQCKYCPASQEACPAINRALNNALDVAMADFAQDTISSDNLVKYLDILKRASELIKLKNDSLETLTITRIKAGESIQGYGLEERYGDRQWNANADPESIKMLTGKDIKETSVMTPAKAERLGLDKKFVAALTHKKFIGTKLKKKDFTKDALRVFGKKE